MNKRSTGVINKVIRNLRTLLESLDDNYIATIDVQRIINVSKTTARKYISILRDTQSVDSILVDIERTGAKQILIRRKPIEITDDLLVMLRHRINQKYYEKYKFTDELGDDEPEIKQVKREGVTVVSANDYHVKIEPKRRRYSASGDSFSAAYFNAGF